MGKNKRKDAKTRRFFKKSLCLAPLRLCVFALKFFMPEPFKLTRIPSLKTVEDFRKHVASLGIELPCEDAIVSGPASPLVQPIDGVTINGKRIGNR